MGAQPSDELENWELVAETPQLRAVILTLAAGQSVPWHYHSEITDTFFCLAGPVVVETQGGRKRTELAVGERYDVPRRTAHFVHGKDGGRCRFLLVQGIGTYDFVPVEAPA